MPRIVWMAVLLLGFAILLAGCGTKSETAVVEDLRAKTDNLDSYRSHAMMTIQSGEERHEYDVEVWYQPPSYYRVALKNAAQDTAQIILRNDEGVFVLTPQDKKHFRFQSNWPDDHGQPYLYQTLLNSVVNDEEREFESLKEGYSFEVKANYKQNQALKTQRIQLDKKYAPVKMALLDADGSALVDVAFDQFEFGVDFDDDAFEMERNMADWGEETATAMASTKNDEAEDDLKVGVLTPGFLPEGVELEGEHKIAAKNGDGVLYRYEGETPFTLMQEPTAASADVPVVANTAGEPVQLGYTMGVLLEKGDQKQLHWSYRGVDFQLQGALSKADITEIARSIYAQSSK